MNPEVKQKRLVLLHFYDQLIAGMEDGDDDAYYCAENYLRAAAAASHQHTLRLIRGSRRALEDMQPGIDE